jgi:hypothetical protein
MGSFYGDFPMMLGYFNAKPRRRKGNQVLCAFEVECGFLFEAECDSRARLLQHN